MKHAERMAGLRHDPSWVPAGAPPPQEVLRAFGARGEPVRLAGGKGGTWRAGDVVLKPSEGDDEVRWRAGVLAGLPESPEFRVARPVATGDGDWIAYGWEATRFVPGRTDQRRVGEVVRAGEAFHAAVAGVGRPGFLDRRDNPWEKGDRLAWEDPPPGERRPSALIDALLAARRPVASAEQVMHADLLGNVLFADGLAPAVIDWAVYWRPAAWGPAVAVIDAMVWHGFDFGLARRWEHVPAWGQLLLRAALFRLGTWDTVGWLGEPVEVYEPVVRDIIAFVGTEQPPGS
ncbi:TIGR02569 family protein [Symbioplanes lichenis]|uniref:TIGR02569 family protein n=1 Tax=Symbioplanes lichenis TaxID=1629072 RepID=UPI00273A36D2|nr:TIGR02569 family protein [Actinoplanes lichenis]